MKKKVVTHNKDNTITLHIENIAKKWAEYINNNELGYLDNLMGEIEDSLINELRKVDKKAFNKFNNEYV